MDALELIQSHLKGQPGSPPIHLWQPELSGEIDIVIKSNGDWIHEGSKIERAALVKLFASILRREKDNHYYLVTPVEKWRLRVEDIPLLIIDMEVLSQDNHDQQIVFTTNVDTMVLLTKVNGLTIELDQKQQPKPIVALDNNLQAKINRAVYYRLVDIATRSDNKLVVLSDGYWFELGEC